VGRVSTSLSLTLTESSLFFSVLVVVSGLTLTSLNGILSHCAMRQKLYNQTAKQGCIQTSLAKNCVNPPSSNLLYACCLNTILLLVLHRARAAPCSIMFLRSALMLVACVNVAKAFLPIPARLTTISSSMHRHKSILQMHHAEAPSTVTVDRSVS